MGMRDAIEALRGKNEREQREKQNAECHGRDNIMECGGLEARNNVTVTRSLCVA
jgi:hypothetical protein